MGDFTSRSRKEIGGETPIIGEGLTAKVVFGVGERQKRGAYNLERKKQEGDGGGVEEEENEGGCKRRGGRTGGKEGERGGSGVVPKSAGETRADIGAKKDGRSDPGGCPAGQGSGGEDGGRAAKGPIGRGAGVITKLKGEDDGLEKGSAQRSHEGSGLCSEGEEDEGFGGGAVILGRARQGEPG
ncbi:glycine-rich cell wall structural protein 1.8-like [Camellia sinensis]|uniref:glycine-rich cell wall structural protein 1.8-like n=1 Tax=Camellia sinensis TaxID=4442 RepID=UPI001035A227|nr:glycine-rich cell wall structural protein 1.8-like [Camellia sinensis]